MPQAAIRWDGNPGPYSSLQVSTPVTISNLNVGGESAWEFALFSKPAGSIAVLADTANPYEKTMTPDVPGTYHTRVIVNGGIIDVSSAAVLHVPATEDQSLIRMPGVAETTEWSSTEGWAEAMKQLFARAAHGFGSKPAASESYRGRTWLTRGGTSVADALEICLKNSSDAYVWEDLLGGIGSVIAGHLPTDVTSQIDGLTNIFTIPAYVSGRLMVMRNGVQERPSTVTELGATTIQLSVVPQVGEWMVVWYVPV